MTAAGRYRVETDEDLNYRVTLDGTWVATFRDEPDAHQYVTDHERRGY